LAVKRRDDRISLRVPFVSGAAIVVAALAGASAALAREPLGASPRAALRELRAAVQAGDARVAGRYLDLSHLSAVERAASGPALARRVHALLERSARVTPNPLSDAPAGDLDDGLPPQRERIGELATGAGVISLELERSGPGTLRPAWRISSRTLRALAPLLAQEVWLARWVPDTWLEARLFGVALWQWLALPLLAALAGALAWLLARVLTRPLRSLCGGAFAADGEKFTRSLVAPEAVLIASFVFRAALPLLALPLALQDALGLAASGLAWLGIVWLGARLADRLATGLLARSLHSGWSHAANLIPLAARIAKLALAAITSLAVLQSVGVNVTGVLAGLGIGGLAVALVAQKTLENLFGGFSLVADHPVGVGDFCRFGDRVGTVEAIGLRSTRIRTLDRTLVTVPNAEFAALPLENFSPRDRIWLRFDLRLAHDTPPETLERVLAALRALLRNGDDLDPNAGHVRLMGLGAYSLDLEIFSYVVTRDWERFLATREALLIAVLRAVTDAGARLALPAQRNYDAATPREDALHDASSPRERAARG
jgi:MscS family membrane protein